MGLEPNQKRKATEQDHQNGVVNIREEHEETLVALVEHRTREVKNLRYYISHYSNQLKEAEKKLQESKSKLALLRGQTSAKRVRIEHESENAIDFKKSQHLPATSNISHSIPLPPSPSFAASMADKSHHVQKTKDRWIKRKLGRKEHEELIPLIRKSSSPGSVVCQTMNSQLSSCHRKRVRCIALCPVNDRRFVTSALDGVVNLWEVHSSGSGASLLGSTDCASKKQSRWPEDMAWDPDGKSVFSVYNADSQDSQISVTDLSKVQRGERASVNFLEDKPHVKGVINSIVFMPWQNTNFVTGGTDHAVIMWNKNRENKWKPRLLHNDYHSSAVMGVAGMQQKQIVLSAGKDKKILGYDVHVGKHDFKHQVDSKCLSVLPNPCDFNLFMVQTSTHERQLRLFDMRSKGTELHAFGWKQESSESQSALINQAWSPNGLFITSGSADPMIHIFDIRYNGHKPSQSIQAHRNRVFRAMWLQSLPLLVSISSDLNIGLHKVV